MTEIAAMAGGLPGIATPDSDGHMADGTMISNMDTSIMSTSSSTSPQIAAAPAFPPPKTDKPRPHVCQTCMRSFARLEHLKRHERSHTKEKPFECPACTRCFARRDLLLRHQQKLHSATTPSSRPRNGRRESATGVATGRVRKNSVATTPGPQMRPRANTVSHIDASAASMLPNGQFRRPFVPMHSQHNSMSALPPHAEFGFRNFGVHNTAVTSGLPRLETQGLPMEATNGLRTAPPYGGFGADFNMSGFGYPNDGSTINPHALHMHNASGMPMDNSWDATQQMFTGMPTSRTMMDEDGFDWVSYGFENQMNFTGPAEVAVDDSSPSAMSTNSPGYGNEIAQPPPMSMANIQPSPAQMWQHPPNMAAAIADSPSRITNSMFLGEMPGPTGMRTISPKSLVAQQGPMYEHNFPTPPDMASLDPASMAAFANGTFILPFKHDHAASIASTASVDSSLRQSSVITTGAELVNDHMRDVLISGLASNSSFGQRRPSQPVISGRPSSTGAKGRGFDAASFPSTSELQRYIAGYIKYFHPHLPFLHIPTLNFESAEYSSSRTPNGQPQPGAPCLAAGGSCLLLSIVALGALFEGEMAHSRELFECAKRLIATYLEERRRSSSARFSHQRANEEDTPLWLVQAMLLNVIYGTNCGDKQAADAASNHCAALVSLARGADLTKPCATPAGANGTMDGYDLNHMQVNADGWVMPSYRAHDRDWYQWKVTEERKRTLYAIFILSSLLVTAYNRAPALTNSEVRLELPCEEDLWCAESTQAWSALGGVAAAESRSVQFASALTHLLTAATREREAMSQRVPGQPWQTQPSAIRPSSLGCLVLINALHNYIWETRQRHLERQWTPPEIESMHAHIEPALRAWQAAWNSNPTHAVERPNPFGAGPLSADSIPLLDLAYVRLFVDFGRSKEAYWQRDYDAMAEELAKSAEVGAEDTNAMFDHSDPTTAGSMAISFGYEISDNVEEARKDDTDFTAEHSQRERHLRKAAFYAADHLIATDRLGTSMGDQHARDLPIQSVLCACDSAQVLAEWVTTVQERVGRYIGVIGRDHIDLTQVPGILLLDDEDRKLLSMIEELLSSVEAKKEMDSMLADAREGGYGSRILAITSEGMARGAVYPVTKLMAQSLQTLAGHVKGRALATVQQNQMIHGQ